MPFDTAQVSPESRTRARLAGRGTGPGDAAPRPLALNLRADIGVRIAKRVRGEPLTDEASCLKSMGRVAAGTR